ncbi:MAG: sterol desaturase family protein [Bacteroidia bacterium]|nr:sterol desaturase family protein [Bacteroidia bacterium]
MEHTKTKVRKSGEVSPRLFENKWLDALTRTHISLPLILFYGSAAGLIIYSSVSTAISGWMIAFLYWMGAVVFTFIEYVMHRWIYHLVPSTSTRERFQYLVHGVHHEFPRDKERLVMPPLISMAIAVGLVLFFRLFMGDYSYSFVAGVVSGYATYLVIHYSVHIFRPPRNFLRKLWTNHAVHHFRDQEVAFGVTSPFWDFVFRTLPEHSKKIKNQAQHN